MKKRISETLGVGVNKSANKSSLTPFILLWSSLAIYFVIGFIVSALTPDDILARPWALTYVENMSTLVPFVKNVPGHSLIPDVAQFFSAVMWSFVPILFSFWCYAAFLACLTPPNISEKQRLLMTAAYQKVVRNPNAYALSLAVGLAVFGALLPTAIYVMAASTHDPLGRFDLAFFSSRLGLAFFGSGFIAAAPICAWVTVAVSTIFVSMCISNSNDVIESSPQDTRLISHIRNLQSRQHDYSMPKKNAFSHILGASAVSVVAYLTVGIIVVSISAIASFHSAIILALAFVLFCVLTYISSRWLTRISASTPIGPLVDDQIFHVLGKHPRAMMFATTLTLIICLVLPYYLYINFRPLVSLAPHSETSTISTSLGLFILGIMMALGAVLAAWLVVMFSQIFIALGIYRNQILEQSPLSEVRK
jgi:hypothetical protein